MNIPPRNDKSSCRVVRDDPYALAFLKAIQVVFQDKNENHNEIVKLLKDFKARDNNSSTKRVKELLKGHTNSILLFNIFMPNEHRITLPSHQHNRDLPWDVLDIIFEKLDFDDFFRFAGVCKNWRAFHKIHWTNFLASQEPLLLQLSYDIYKRLFSFVSIPGQKVYSSNMMDRDFTYVMFSSGYFILEKSDYSLLLINPFTRTKMVINTPPFEFDAHVIVKCVLLAFDKCSEEFVFVLLGCYSLDVYQSRNRCWVTYSTMRNLQCECVVDVVVLHNIIHVITNRARIGVLNLNSSNIKYLKLKSTHNIMSRRLRLVNCDEQLLVVDFMTGDFEPMRINVYKIDFSTMNYVKLKTLGDIALFHAWNGLKSKCYALSNPNKWGYESNSVYVLNNGSTICSVYTWDDKKLQKCITLPPPTRRGITPRMHEWCFRHLRYEIDYSLVE